MIFVQNLFRLFQIDDILRRCIPRKLQDALDIAAQHGSVGGSRLQPQHALDFLFDFIVCLFFEVQFFQLCQPALHFFLDGILLAQFALNCTHLLSQIIFSLIFVDAVFDLLRDLLFDLENFIFSPQKFADHLETLRYVYRFQDLLLLICLEFQVGSDDIRQTSGRRDGFNSGKDLRRQFLRHFHVIHKLAEDSSSERFRLRIVLLIFRFRHIFDLRSEIRHILQHLEDFSP